MSIFFIKDSRNRVLSPTLRINWVRKQIDTGKAKFIRGSLFLIQLNYPILTPSRDTDTQFIIGLDSGYKNIGFSIFKISKTKISKLFSGEVTLRTEEIKELLTERKMYRQSRRRCRRKRRYSVKFRHPRYSNRRNKLKLSPTARNLILSHENVINKILRYIPIERVKINLEYFKFDKSKVNAAGSKSSFSNIRYFVYDRDNYTCQACRKTKVELEAHHKVERSKGGTDNPNNLITLCKSCHSKHHSCKINANNITSVKRKDSGVLNTVMPYIYKKLAERIPTYKYFGFETADIRSQLKLEKSHINDANILANLDIDSYNKIYEDFKITPLYIHQIRRHPSRAKTSRLEDRKYKRIDWSDRSESYALNRGSERDDKENERIGQKEKTLFRLRKLGKLGAHDCSVKLKAIPGGRVYRQDNNDFNPGDLVRNTVTKEAFIVKGIGAGYKVYGFYGESSPRQNPKTKSKQSATVKLKSNSGLCII